MSDDWLDWIGGMTPEKAIIIRNMRIGKGYSWRKVASEAHELFRGEWEPASNQIAGMALCEHAAKEFGEDYMQEPWN